MVSKKAKSEREYLRLIIEAAFKLIIEKGWPSITLADLSDATGMSLKEIHDLTPSKAMIIHAYVKHLKQQVLDDYQVDRDETVRERLFDLLMQYFDLFQQQREAVKAIATHMRKEPDLLCICTRDLFVSMQKILDTVQVKSIGCRGLLRVKSLSAIFISTYVVWAKDETPDMAQTMAHLDKLLSNAEQWELTLKSPFLQRWGQHV